HVAPPPRTVLAAVEEDPLASRRGAFLYPVELWRRKEIRRGARDLPERPLQRVAISGQGPPHAVAVVDEPFTGSTRCGRAAGEPDFVVRDRGNVAHLTHPTA